MSRELNEWIGRDDNEPVPPRVRLRVFERNDGRCQLCSRRLYPHDKWTCDHAKAIINGGPNRESNLQTICDWCDKKTKTPADVAEKAKTYAVRSKHLGIKRAKKSIPGRKFDGTPIPARWMQVIDERVSEEVRTRLPRPAFEKQRRGGCG